MVDKSALFAIIKTINNHFEKEIEMRLTPPKKIVFYISAALVLLAILGFFITIPFVSQFAFWFAVVGYLLLAAGNALKGF